MTRLDTHKACLWYMRELDTGPTPVQLRAMSLDEIDSYLKELRAAWSDVNPSEAEAWDRA